jgi:hypothetical protein
MQLLFYISTDLFAPQAVNYATHYPSYGLYNISTIYRSSVTIQYNHWKMQRSSLTLCPDDEDDDVHGLLVARQIDEQQGQPPWTHIRMRKNKNALPVLHATSALSNTERPWNWNVPQLSGKFP